MIENEDFIQVARAEDLGKLYGDTLSSVKQIAETHTFNLTRAAADGLDAIGFWNRRDERFISRFGFHKSGDISIGTIGMQKFRFFAPSRSDVSFTSAHIKTQGQQSFLSCQRVLPILNWSVFVLSLIHI